ncbi:10320_t:CDS:2 [Entrophospora sp. SA101]|nr:10320_t:CDS:2 [Entrophospora sp. SA101]
MTFFENITREAFAGDRGKVNGTNKSFVWAILNAFLGTENNSLHLGEKMIVPLMAKYEVKLSSSLLITSMGLFAEEIFAEELVALPIRELIV